jgi:DNA primase
LADDWVQQVKEANDIVAVVGAYLALRPAGPTFKGLCPFHDDSRPSFDVDPRRQRFRCWACGKFGDVITFVQEFDKVDFVEALELLARRAGITREKTSSSPQNQGRALMLEVVRWATHQYHECLLDSPLAEEARAYLGQRGLTGETVRRYQLGYAPRHGEWLVQKGEASQVSLELLEKVGLIACRNERPGYYDRFRDRVQFPIRDVRGQPVGFGGRIMPSSPFASRGPKYYNSSDTPLFTKSEHLYGLDQARQATNAAGYLAVVEGYTDVLMAHQLGVGQVVATMGTALNARHVQNLRRFVPRVVLVFDADAGGATGVDRALEIFASHDVDLAIATLPEGLDPCDLLVQQGAEAFRRVLESAVDALDFKLKRVLAEAGPLGVEGQRRAVDAVLGIIALAPPLPGQAGAVKTQLMVSRIARRLVLKEETVWARLEELRGQRRDQDKGAKRLPAGGDSAVQTPQAARAAPEERELLEVLLADDSLVPLALAEISLDQIEHPGLRRLLDGLYALHQAGLPATLDQLRARLDSGPLAEHALKLQDVGRRNPDRAAWLGQILLRFRERRERPKKEELQNQLHAVGSDYPTALELLRQRQNQNVELGPDASATAGVRS